MAFNAQPLYFVGQQQTSHRRCLLIQPQPVNDVFAPAQLGGVR